MFIPQQPLISGASYAGIGQYYTQIQAQAHAPIGSNLGGPIYLPPSRVRDAFWAQRYGIATTPPAVRETQPDLHIGSLTMPGIYRGNQTRIVQHIGWGQHRQIAGWPTEVGGQRTEDWQYGGFQDPILSLYERYNRRGSRGRRNS